MNSFFLQPVRILNDEFMFEPEPDQSVDSYISSKLKTTDQLKEYESIRFMLEGAKAKFTCDWCSVKELKKLLEYVNKKLQQNNCSC